VANRSASADLSPAQDCFASAGEMGARMRAFDWAGTSVGPVADWPQSLKTAIRIILNSRYPMFVWWGRELTNFYNDAYISVLGKRHPEALGKPAATIWTEIWDIVGAQADAVLNHNAATWNEELLLVMERYGYAEETYFTFSYSPIPNDDGSISGVFCAAIEATKRVLGERRLLTLRELAARTAEAKTVEEACALSAAALAINAHDLPFALIYLLNDNGKQAQLAGATGIEPGGPASPLVVELNTARQSRRLNPLRSVVATGNPYLLRDVLTRYGRLPGGPWPEPVQSAIVLPISQVGQKQPIGLLIAGISPRRPFDDDYQGFFELIAGQVANAIANAQAYEAERQRAEALAELDRAKTDFFSNVSHEFRTPLTLMLGPLEYTLAGERGPLNEAQRESLVVVQRNGLRLLKLVNTLLDFSRIEAGRIDAVYEATDLAQLTAELASVFRSAIESAGLRFTVACPELPEPIYVDREMWEKIILNLLSNAFKFTFEGEISVALGWTGTHAELCIRDTGIGIPKAEMPHLFERFHRIRGARSRSHEGTGIGLALVQELVRLHGGSIQVESVVGQGTTFIIRIPASAAHLPAERIGAQKAPASSPPGAAAFVEEATHWLPEPGTGDRGPGVGEAPMKREASFLTDDQDSASAHQSPDTDSHPLVLVADDNADMRDYVRRLLNQRWTIEVAPDGLAALRAARERRPDLILTDVMMPALDGFELLRELRADENLKQVPVILLSARAGEESRIEGLEAGADDYLVKPFSARELIARVGAHLEMARLRREAAERERQVREAAERTNRMKDEFLATLSHELRTPLNSILGWTEMLRRGQLDGPLVQQAIEVIHRNSKMQVQLIEDILDVSRIIAGKFRLKVNRLELLPIIQSAIDSILPAAAAKKLTIGKLFEPGLGPVSGDPARLQQVIWNLLSNAVKFTPPEGRIDVHVKRVGANAEIRVSDSGQGITADLLPHIFERFRQADSSYTRKHTGLGLGLAIVRHIVELHGGHIEAHSKGDGQGSTFKITLPLALLDREGAADQSELSNGNSRPTAAGQKRLEGLRLLLVDDNEDTRDMLAAIFHLHGAEVRRSATAREAYAELQQWRPDILISDIGMPEADGYSLIQQVRQLRATQGGDTPAIALTGYAGPEEGNRTRSEGFQIHLAKPVVIQELLDAIVKLAGKH
jgi:signal transduction histidine kinase